MNANRVPTGTRAAVVVVAGLAALALGVGSGAAALASASPRPHPKPGPAKLEPTKLSIRNKAIAHSRHHAVNITGLLSADDMGVANETVDLEARLGLRPHWHLIAVAITGADGKVTFAVAPRVKTQYQLVFLGDSHFGPSESNVITLR